MHLNDKSERENFFLKALNLIDKIITQALVYKLEFRAIQAGINVITT